jgi:hypothetical protein
LWNVAPEQRAFAPGELRGDADDVTIWKTVLPDRAIDGYEGLLAAKGHCHRIVQTLEQAPGRLDVFLEEAVSMPRVAGVLPTDSRVDWRRPEEEMLFLLGDLRGDSLGDARAFGFPRWKDVRDQFERFIVQIQRFVLNFAHVETEHRGKLIARTVVSWTGDVRNTLWRRDQELTALHLRSLALAVQTRWNWLKIIQLATEGARRIATVMAFPFGVVAAVPLAWWYIRRILDELPSLSAPA